MRGPLYDPLHRRLQPLRYLHDCSDCFRPERQGPGGTRTRWKTVPLHGARETNVTSSQRFLVPDYMRASTSCITM